MTLQENRQDLLARQDDWDDAGAKAVNPVRLDCCIQFVEKLQGLYQYEMNGELPDPYIDPKDDVAFFIHWIQPTFELLMSYPGSDEEQITFYGDNLYFEDQIEGGFKESENSGWRTLLFWIRERQGIS